MCGMVLTAAPTFTFGLLITFVAVARWNLWGLTVVPLMAAANLVGGHFNDLLFLAATYDWRIFVSTLLGLLTVGINVIFFKKFGTKKTIHNTMAMIGLVLLNYAMFCAVQFVVYRLLTSGNLLERGVIEYAYKMRDPETQQVNTTILNLCKYGEGSYVYNVLGLVIAVAGLFVLRFQGVVNNVVDKFIEDKKNAELNRLDDENFAILETSDVSDEAKEESESSDTKDSPGN